MEKEVKRSTLNNESFKERFQFLFWINDNIICQRYFKINGFNSNSLGSEELLEALEECVAMIKEDLHHKSFVYQSIVNNQPIKMTGFHNDMEDLGDLYKLINDNIKGSVTLSDGTKIWKTYFTHDDDINEVYDDEHINPWDVTFKFEFIVDERPVFQRIWDASVYPKFVRNSVDLSNSITAYNRGGGVNFVSNEGIANYLKVGRIDLVYHIIKKIVETMSGNFDDPDAYTHTINFDDCVLEFDKEKEVVVPIADLRDNPIIALDCETTKEHPVKKMGEKEYYYTSYNGRLINSYRKWTQEKTRKYNNWLYRCEKYANQGGLTPSEWRRYEERY